MNHAIQVRGLGKCYRIRHRASKKGDTSTLREEIATTLRNLITGRGRLDGSSRTREDFWALRDVTFDIPEGEAVGFIGHNGAGKSTLLKLISRITEPTTGEIDLRGRVASILEVATGFHPELTGRENIYLKGAIMGLKRTEIRQRFDAIVEFSEVEQFLDTPVKRYSSGMYVKLGFAVAAHLDPEILVVDEVLAVGDTRFQKKCIDKMQAIMRQDGRTILFVSHNLSLIQSLCGRALLLSGGRLMDDGRAADVVSRYLDEMERGVEGDIATRTDRSGVGEMRLTKVEALGGGNDMETRGVLTTGMPVRFVFHVNKVMPETTCFVAIRDRSGVNIANFDTEFYGPNDRFVPGQEREFVVEMDELPLVPGRYSLLVRLNSGQVLQDKIAGAAGFEVQRAPYKGRQLAPWGGIGAVSLDYRWLLPERLR